MPNSLSHKEKGVDEDVFRGNTSGRIHVSWGQDVLQVFKSLFCYSGLRNVLFMVALCLLSLELSAAEMIGKEFNLGSASPTEVERAVKPLLSENGKLLILPGRGKVFVQDDSQETLDFVTKVMQSLTAPKPNIRVEIGFQEMNKASSFGVSQGKQGVSVENGKIRIKPIENNPFGGGVSIGSKSTTQSRFSKQFLVVRSGSEAALRVGKDVPFVDSFFHYAYVNGYQFQKTRWEFIGTYLRVRPIALANGLIDVQVTPEISALINGRHQTIQYRTLTTSVIVSPGREVTLGGFEKASSQFNTSFLRALAKGSGSGSGGFKLKAMLQ
ncbi:MAG: hypothetical protein AAGA18_01595 [Verrucomicrobiota bacterium]